MNAARRSMAVRVPAVVLCGLLALAGCDRQAADPGSGAGAIPVVTTVVQPRPWSDTVQGLGTVRARESVTLTAKVSEIVEQVHFESGQKVVAGQPLVTLRVDAQRAALMEAEAAAAEAEQQYRRLQSLAGQQLVSQATLDTQRATRDAAVARVRQMQSDIGDRQVRAPFSGVLGIRQVSPGALLTPNAVIATLDDIARVYVDFQVPETELSRIAANAVVAARGAAGAHLRGARADRRGADQSPDPGGHRARGVRQPRRPAAARHAAGREPVPAAARGAGGAGTGGGPGGPRLVRVPRRWRGRGRA